MTAGVQPSATLAIGEALDALRLQGRDVLPMASGEIRLPAAPRLQQELRTATEHNDYGPVAGIESYREAAAGYWHRRGVDADASRIITGPGSKALLFASLLALGGDVIVPRPSWVSYTAQATLAGLHVIEIDTVPGAGGVPDPDAVAEAARTARRSGRSIRVVVTTLPDNPTGDIAGADIVQRLTDVAREHDLIIVSDEIYYDLAFDEASVRGASPISFAPERTIVTTGLTKNLAVGGWRTGFALFPQRGESPSLFDSVCTVASHIWSSPTMPVQHAAAYALTEPPEIVAWMSAALHLHRSVARAANSVLRTEGLVLPKTRGTCYLYPDFSLHRDALRAVHNVESSADLTDLLLRKYAVAALPGSAFGDPHDKLTVRLSTSQLYGSTVQQQQQALDSPDPLTLPWIVENLDRLHDAVSALHLPA
ncbi:pyridoxal phosphate-dependent aminotransferase [Rhodococcus erythropolis]|uniref:pyridoxal phosphate-dependent aminotransferase n=1 Tax=Rhodococcus erythropolis TaxID=1833 RepID=UPI001BE71F39|nr:pyridoxal phosphate-dependent aminotransferase [Rhodococcus erythropolis]MBT2263417.1 pyridoxal phosphate-dependent aminotransferase [Rhodococcus erythropolis]